MRKIIISISVLCLVLGISLGRYYQKDIYRERAVNILNEAKKVSNETSKELDTMKILHNLIKKHIDSITVRKTVYIKK